MSERPDDLMGRQTMLADIRAAVAGLAAMPTASLPSPRAISVQGDWGAGKSWLAAELAEQLKSEGNNFAIVDLFRFDYHDDPFAVIAAAIFKELNPSAEKKKAFLTAAGAVMKAGVPIAIKAAAKKATSAIGIDDSDIQALADAATEKTGELSAKAVEKIFANYVKTQEIQDNFVKQFTNLTLSLEKPFVVIVDELDRCRPSFALETLERVKHLFSAENVVFVFFWNVKSIHESIKHTYGDGIDAERYLSKFVALEMTVRADQEFDDGREYGPFIQETGRAYFGPSFRQRNIERQLREAAKVLRPSLRDLQRAIYTWSKHSWFVNNDTMFAGYFILLYSISPSRLDGLRKKSPESARYELKNSIFHGRGEISNVQCLLAYIADAPRYDGLILQVTTGQITPPTDRLDARVVELAAYHGMTNIFNEIDLVFMH